MPGDVRQLLVAEKAKGTVIVAVGGQAASAVGTLADESFAGSDRYGTSAQLARGPLFWPNEFWGLASGNNFPDALSGGAVMAYLGGPMLLTAPTVLPATVRSALSAQHAMYGTGAIFGGTAAVSDAVGQQALGVASGGSSLLLPFSAALNPAGS